MNNLDKAKKLLFENKYTCVLCKEDEVFCSEKKGVKPLVEFLESKHNFRGFSAADKTVGAGAAHIYVLIGIKEIWANIVSEEAEDILKKNGICIIYEKKVPYIINRAGDGKCPIEKCVQGIFDSKEAYEKIKETLSRLLQ